MSDLLYMQGALIAANVALEQGDLLRGLILSAPPLLFQSPYPLIGSLLVSQSLTPFCCASLSQ